MAITNIQKQCRYCFNYYPNTIVVGVTPFNVELYCSLECQQADEQRLAEGNSLVDAAQKENPLLFISPAPSEEKRSDNQDTLNDLKRMLKIER